MATIPDGLAQRILAALGSDPLADELRRALTPSNGEAVFHISIPERFAPHFAGALSVGATAARMCSNTPEAVSALRKASNDLRDSAPAFFADLWHVRDGERIMEMVVIPGIEIGVVPARSGWRNYDVILRDGSREFRPGFKADLEEDAAQEIARQVQELAERLGEPAPQRDRKPGVPA